MVWISGRHLQKQHDGLRNLPQQSLHRSSQCLCAKELIFPETCVRCFSYSSHLTLISGNWELAAYNNPLPFYFSLYPLLSWVDKKRKSPKNKTWCAFAFNNQTRAVAAGRHLNQFEPLARFPSLCGTGDSHVLEVQRMCQQVFLFFFKGLFEWFHVGFLTFDVRRFLPTALKWTTKLTVEKNVSNFWKTKLISLKLMTIT